MWLEELAAPYYIFQEKECKYSPHSSIVVTIPNPRICNGSETCLVGPAFAHSCCGDLLLFAPDEITIASPAGGPIPLDENSLKGGFLTEAAKKFLLDAAAMGQLCHSVKLDTIDFGGVDAIFLSAGHGVCADYVDCPPLKAAIEGLYAANKPVAAVCHAPVGLVQCKLPDGTPLVKGKKVTGFSDTEEDAVGLSAIVPFMTEARLKELGASYEKADDWHSKVCVDGNLITGQNPQSSEAGAMEVVKMISA